MRNVKHCGWVLAACLFLPANIGAQQSGDQPASAPPPAVQPVSAAPGIALAQPAARVPVSVDQVVDQII